MKKMDVKKIGAVVGGAALLASSVAFGAVLYENTTLVDANGQIVAKVVVGENAAATDGVGAAKIAAALASKAYKPVTYSAQVEGTAVCTATANTTGGCTVTDQRADIAVIMPGLTSTSVVTIDPLIAEELDQELGDREYTDYFDVTTEFWDDDANPYQDQDGNTPNVGGGVAQENATLVDYRNFDAFQIWDVSGKYLDGQGIKEKERAYVKGYSWYDAGDNDVKFKLKDLVYEAVFGPGARGLPLCPGDVDTSFAACSSDKRIESSRAAIKFLGEKWYITKVELPAATTVTWATDEDIVEVPGARVHLAKEAQYGIVNVGEYLETPDGKYKVRLDDINKNDLAGNPAIISVLDENNQTLVQDQVAPGQTKELALPGGKVLKVHVYQTAPGHALQAKWAEMALLEDSIILESGQDFLKDPDTQYTVYVGFANKNPAGGAEPSTRATHLKYIALTTSSLGEDLAKGDKFYLADVEGYKNFVLKYEGLSESPETKLVVKYRTSPKTGTLADGASTFDVQEYIEVDAGTEVRFNNADDGSGTTMSKRVDKFYYVVSAAAGSTVDEGDVLLRADGEWYFVEGSGGTISVDYKKAGSNGKLHMYDAVAGNTEVEFSLEELVGDIGGTPAYRNVSVKSDAANDKLVGLNGAQDDEVTWDKDSIGTPGFGYTSNTDYETLFITPRGTMVKGSGDSRTFEVPEKVRRVELFFKPEGNYTAEPNTVVLRNMTEGEERVVPGGDGLKVKVLKFYAQTSGSASCPTPEADMTGVSAVIYQGDTRVGATATAYVPAYETSFPSVVVFDTSNEANAATVVSVGGPVVNQKTAELLQGSDVTLDADNRVVVKQVAPGKIVVAGWTAEDTLQAVDQFLGELTTN